MDVQFKFQTELTLWLEVANSCYFLPHQLQDMLYKHLCHSPSCMLIYHVKYQNLT